MQKEREKKEIGVADPIAERPSPNPYPSRRRLSAGSSLPREAVHPFSELKHVPAPT
jgi:hypothetical protein